MGTIQLFLYVFLYGTGIAFPVQNTEHSIDCLNCHKSLIEQKVVHPVADGCDNCHASNGQSHPQSGIKGFDLADAVPSLCFMCHDNIQSAMQKSVSVHGALTTKKSCVACHSPHSSAQQRMLLKEEKELCLSCHNKTIKSDSSSISNIKQLLDKGKVVHGAIEMDGCKTCHVPHASEFPHLLNAAFPAGNYTDAKTDNFALCFSCHDSQMITQATTKSATGFRNGEKNLHYLHINGSKGRSCNNCHNMHASQNDHMIDDFTTFGEWEMPLRYLTLEGGGSCSPGCHGEKKYLR